MFVLENFGEKIFQIHWTLIGEEVKTLQIYYIEPDITISGFISTLEKMEVLMR